MASEAAVGEISCTFMEYTFYITIAPTQVDGGAA